ncbi:hypothetical protein ACQKGD_10780 [Peribacillus frigoritolerans]
MVKKGNRVGGYTRPPIGGCTFDPGGGPREDLGNKVGGYMKDPGGGVRP